MNFQEANDLIRPLNIDEENSITYKAAIIFFIGTENGWDEEIIEYSTGYTKEDIRLILKNWGDNNILIEGVIHGDFDGENDWMEVILIAMCGSGELRRTKSEISKKEDMPKKTLNEHLFDQLDRLSDCDADNIELEMNKANSIINVAEQILSVAKMKLEIIQSGVSVGETFKEIANIPEPALIENGHEEAGLINQQDNLDNEDLEDVNRNWANGFRSNKNKL